MTDKIKKKLNNTINKLCDDLCFTTPLNIMKVAAATTDLFYDLHNENDELSNSVTELTNSVTELEKKVTKLKQQIEKMKRCSNCKHFNKDYELCFLSGGDEDYCCRNRRWELAE